METTHEHHRRNNRRALPRGHIWRHVVHRVWSGAMSDIGDTGTLAELDVREGDVVRHLGYSKTCLIKSRNGELWVWEKGFGYWSCPVNQAIGRYKLISSAAPPIWRDMTAEQKLVIALAKIAGKTIEWLCDGHTWLRTKFNDPQDDIAYRVRPPEPKVETVTLGVYQWNNDWYGRERDARSTHNVTWKTYDGKPDCTKCKTCGTAPIDMEEL